MSWDETYHQSQHRHLLPKVEYDLINTHSDCVQTRSGHWDKIIFNVWVHILHGYAHHQ